MTFISLKKHSKKLNKLLIDLQPSPFSEPPPPALEVFTIGIYVLTIY